MHHEGSAGPGQYDEALGILVKVGEVLKKELAGMGLTLIDFKIEVGYDENGKMYVVDEITPDIWRVRDEQGNIPNQIDCAKLILGRSKETAFPVAGPHSKETPPRLAFCSRRCFLQEEERERPNCIPTKTVI